MPWVKTFGKENMTRDEILKKLEENRETIRGFGVRRLGIFGSYARDEHTGASDMDFLVEFGMPHYKTIWISKSFSKTLPLPPISGMMRSRITNEILFLSFSYKSKASFHWQPQTPCNRIVPESFSLGPLTSLHRLPTELSQYQVGVSTSL